MNKTITPEWIRLGDEKAKQIVFATCWIRNANGATRCVLLSDWESGFWQREDITWRLAEDFEPKTEIAFQEPEPQTVLVERRLVEETTRGTGVTVSTQYIPETEIDNYIAQGWIPKGDFAYVKRREYAKWPDIKKVPLDELDEHRKAGWVTLLEPLKSAVTEESRRAAVGENMTERARVELEQYLMGVENDIVNQMPKKGLEGYITTFRERAERAHITVGDDIGKVEETVFPPIIDNVRISEDRERERRLNERITLKPSNPFKRYNNGTL